MLYGRYVEIAESHFLHRIVGVREYCMIVAEYILKKVILQEIYSVLFHAKLHQY